METKEKTSGLECVGMAIKSLAEKYDCTRQYVTKVLMGQTGLNTVKAQKILADARDIAEVLRRETIITI